MIDALNPAPVAPSVDDYIAAGRRRRRQFAIWIALLAALTGGSFVVMGIDNIILPLTVLLIILTPVLLWRYPRLALYGTFVAVCLFEIEPTSYSDALTDRVPFWWNINTIFQRYGHINFKAIPLNLFEVFILTAGICSVLQAVFSGNTKIRGGALLWPFLLYAGFVVMGWVNGLATGGDFKISLQEVRAQFYLVIAYLMAVNLVKEQKQIGGLLWTFALCEGLKGILYTFRRYVTLHGMPLPDQGVGSHEEAFFFDGFAVLLVVLVLCNVYKKLQYVMWALLPLVIIGNLACNRRAATAAMVVAVPILLIAAYRALPERRKVVGWVSAILAIGFSIYYPMYKNSSGLIGEPARAIHSQFAPDERDASSNAYRDAENADLMATIKLDPIQGYGYGKRMLHAVPIADISQQYEWWDIMTHNQILWVWMRVGTFGFITFWAMVSAILIYAGIAMRKEGATNEIKAVCIFAMIVVAMLMIFGLLDLQLANFRDMIFAGFCAGIMLAVSTFPAHNEKTALRRAPS